LTKNNFYYKTLVYKRCSKQSSSIGVIKTTNPQIGKLI
jgi:hypothetical protein